MSAVNGSGGGPGPPPPQSSPTPLHSLINPGQESSGPAWAGAGCLGGNNYNMRDFSTILEQEKYSRNILEIKIVKITTTDSEGAIHKPKHLTFDDLGELIFDVLQIDPEHCLTFDYNTGRYDTREIRLKPKVNVDSYVTKTPITYKEHLVTVAKQLHNVTRVTFKYVPLNVPDEEILHLCDCYGTPLENKVHYETLTNNKNMGMTGSTRYVDVVLRAGASFENYYWLEGPLQGDRGRRILVLHHGQTQQCSHCLKRTSTGCPAGGNGKLCDQMKTPRAKMFTYMQSLRAKVGYVSLKTRYNEIQAKNFPSLFGDEQIENVSNMAN